MIAHPSSSCLDHNTDLLYRSAKPDLHQPARADTHLHTPTLPEHLIGNGHIPASKAQISSSALSAAALDQQEEEDGDSVDADQDSMLVGDSSSVISASHAATDGSRSVQSSRTVLDRMPEFNMDDAVSFRYRSNLLPLCQKCQRCMHSDAGKLLGHDFQDVIMPSVNATVKKKLFGVMWWTFQLDKTTLHSIAGPRKWWVQHDLTPSYWNVL